MDKKNKLIRLAKAVDITNKGSVAITKFLFELEDRLDAVHKELANKQEVILEKASEKMTEEELVAIVKPLIPVVKDGETPSEDSLLELIKPLIPKVKDGKTPTKKEILAIIKPLIPEPQKVDIDRIIERATEETLKQVKIPDVKKEIKESIGVIRDELAKEENQLDISEISGVDELIKKLPVPKNIIATNKPLSELLDVNVQGLQNNQSLKWNGREWIPYTPSSGGGGAWGSITGTLSDQTDLQNALNAKVTANSAITGATKTKITYDAKGLVTSGTDATTDDIADSLNKRYVTDANLVVIGNTSGTNTGDQVGDGVTITGTGTVGDPFVSVAGGSVSDGDKGDITVSSSGTVWTVDNGLDATKIADGTVSNTEFQYINSLTSNAQDQLNDKLPYTIPDDTAKDLFQYRPATLNGVNGTGTIVVLLDDTSTTTNKYFAGVIRGHNYVDRSEFVIKFSALWYSASFQIASPPVLSVEGSAYFGSIRFAYDASNRPCLLIGTTSYAWHADSRVTLEQLYSSYTDNTEYQRIRDNAPVQTITRITSETGYTIRETKPVAAIDTYTNTNLVKVWGGATPWDYRYSIFTPINIHSGSNTTGTVAIKLPAFVNTVYNIIEVKGFDYTSTTGGWRVTVSGLTNGTNWINSSVNVEGKPPFTSVRLAYIGADYCILLGTTATTWGRMNISLDLHHKVGSATDPIYTNATDYSITTAITSEASYSVKATYDCAFNAQRFYSGSGSTALPSHSFYGDANTGASNPIADTYVLSTGGTEYFRISSTGTTRVGSGTVGNIPSSTSGNFTSQFGSSATSGVAAIATGINDGTRNPRAGLFVNDTSGIWGLSHLYASGRLPFVLISNTTEQLRVDTSHNLGVGTGATVSARIHAISTTEQQRLGYDASNYLSTTISSTGGVTFDAVGSGAGFTFSDSVTMADAKDLIFNTTTGTKIGTATTQKLGFWNATPVVQQVTAAYTSDGEGVAYTGVDNLQVGSVYATVADLNQLRVAYETLRASYDDLLTKLKNTGIVA